MELTGRRYIVYNDPDAVFKLTAISDVHLFNKGCCEKKLEQDIQSIEDDPYNYWLSLGDMCDFIGIGDKRFDPEAISFYARVKDLGNLGVVGRNEVINRFDPIKEKCLGVGVGNHELSYMKHMNQSSLVKDMAKIMNTWFLGYSSYSDIVLIYSPQSKNCPKLIKNESELPKGQSWFFARVFTHHGHGYARTQGGKMNKLTNFMDQFDADITFIGHLHDHIVKTKVRLRGNGPCEEAVEIPQIGVMTGSYLRTYTKGHTGYGEVKAYDPVPLGAVSVSIEPKTGKMTGLVSIEPHKMGAMDEPDYDRWIELLEKQEECENE